MSRKKGEILVKGVLKSVIVTVIMLLILAVIMVFKDINIKELSMAYLVITIISIMFGAVYSSKQINKNGWLMGLIVSFVYIIIMYTISIFSGNSLNFSFDKIIRLILALIVGMLSGMIGVNF